MKKRVLSFLLLFSLIISLMPSAFAEGEKTQAPAVYVNETPIADKFTLPTDRKIKVACVGDSITHGTDDRGYPSYPRYLQDILGEKYDVQNFGVGGTTLMYSENISAAYTRCDMYQPSLDFEPDIVIIMLGTNDSGAYAFKRFEKYFKSDYQELINTYKNLPSHPYVIVATSPYLVGTHHTVNEVIVPYQRQIFSEMEGIDGVVDIYEWSKDKYYLYKDGVHYMDNGYYSLAMKYAEEIFGISNGYHKITVNCAPNGIIELNKQGSAVEYNHSVAADENGVAACYANDGDYTITVRADGYVYYSANVTISGDCTVNCDMQKGDYNVALYASVTASSFVDEGHYAENANDENYASCFQPMDSDKNAWLLFDLLESKEIHGIMIESWFQAYASGYYVEVSDDGENFTKVATVSNGKGDPDDIHFFDSARGRYVKVTFTNRGYLFNYEIYDLKLFSNDERTVSQREKDVIAAREEAERKAREAEEAASKAAEKPLVWPWIVADVVIVALAAVAIVLILKKRP